MEGKGVRDKVAKRKRREWNGGGAQWPLSREGWLYLAGYLCRGRPSSYLRHCWWGWCRSAYL